MNAVDWARMAAVLGLLRAGRKVLAGMDEAKAERQHEARMSGDHAYVDKVTYEGETELRAALQFMREAFGLES